MLLDNKAIVRRLYEEAWNKRRLDVVDELISASHARNEPVTSGSQMGPNLYKRRVVELTASFPDLRFTIEDMMAERRKNWRLLDYLGGSPGRVPGYSCHGQQDSREGNNDSRHHKRKDS
jgi:predicted ester cyclase